MKCRLISLFLVITMVFGMFPQTLSIYAEEMQTSKGTQKETPVEKTVLPSELVTSQDELISFGSTKSSLGTRPTISAVYNRLDHYLLDTNIDSATNLLSVAVDSGYFKLPTSLSDGSENGVIFEGGVLHTIEGERLATTTDSLRGVSFKIDTSVAGYRSVLNGIKYYPSNSTTPQNLKCTTSNIELEPGDRYFGGHVYRYVPSSVLGNNTSSSKNMFKALDYVYTTASDFYTELGTPYLATSTRKAENDFLVNLTAGKPYAFIGSLAYYKDAGLTQKFTASELNAYNDLSDFTKYLPTPSSDAAVNAQQYYWMDGATNEAGMNVNYTQFNAWHPSHPLSFNGGVEIGWGGPYWSDDGGYTTLPAIVEWGRSPLGADNPVSISSNILSVTLSGRDFKYYVKSTGDDMGGNGTSTNPYKTIEHAMAEIKAVPQAITGDAIISVMDDITINGLILLDFARNVTITTTDLNQDGSLSTTSSPVTTTRGSSYPGTLFKINSSGYNLNIQNIAINGGDIESTNMISGFSSDNGTLMLDNVSVTNHKNANVLSEFFYVLSDGILTIRNSEIENNVSAGGLFYSDGKLTIDTGCTISNNTAREIFNLYGTQIVFNNPTITSNTTNTEDGRIVNFNGYGSATVNGANISGNKRTNNIVEISDNKIIILNGKTNPVSISNNNDISGYAVKSYGGILKMGGNINIGGNGSTGKNNVYLYDDQTIKLTDSTTDSAIGVTVQLPPSRAGEKVKFAEKDEDTYYTLQASDENNFIDNSTDSSDAMVKTLTDGIYLIFKYDAVTPVIINQPVDGSQVEESTVPITLSITATASDNPPGTLSYQWYSNTIDSNTGGKLIEGATSSTYVVPNATPSKLYYYCVVENTNDTVSGIKTATKASDTANVIILTKTINPDDITIGAPTINEDDITMGTNPASITINTTNQGYGYNIIDSNTGKVIGPWIQGTGTAIDFEQLGDDTEYEVVIAPWNTGLVPPGVNTELLIKSGFVVTTTAYSSTDATGNNNGFSGNTDTTGNNKGSAGNTDSANSVESNLAKPPETSKNVADSTPSGVSDIDYGVSDNLNTSDHFAYLKGYNNKFRPDESISRAEVSQMFYNLLLDKNIENSEVKFSDIPKDSWYENAVNTLTNKGFIHGYPDGTFRPGQSITRAEFITMVCQSAKPIQGDSNFVDVPEDYWAYESMNMAVKYGWIMGYRDGTFRPDTPITRAEAIVIANKMLGRKIDEKYIDSNIVNMFTDVPDSHWAYYNIMEATSY